MSLILPRLVCYDEAGFTGSALLDPAQPYFSYASHDLSLAEADRGRVPGICRSRWRLRYSRAVPVSGVTAAMPYTKSRLELRDLSDRVFRHLREDCVMPDFEVLDPSGEQAPVNWLLLEDLAARADAGADPLEGLL